MKLNARQKAHDPAVLTSSSTATTAVEWYNLRRMVHMITTNTHTSSGCKWQIVNSLRRPIRLHSCSSQCAYFSHTLYLGSRQSEGANWILHSAHISFPLQMCETYKPSHSMERWTAKWCHVVYTRFPNCIFPFHSRKAPTHCPYVADLTWPDYLTIRRNGRQHQATKGVLTALLWTLPVTSHSLLGGTSASIFGSPDGGNRFLRKGEKYTRLHGVTRQKTVITIGSSSCLNS